MNHKTSSMARKKPKIDGYAPQRAIFTPILPRNPENGALRPGFCDFYAHFSVLGPLRPPFSKDLPNQQNGAPYSAQVANLRLSRYDRRSDKETGPWYVRCPVNLDVRYKDENRQNHY